MTDDLKAAVERAWVAYNPETSPQTRDIFEAGYLAALPPEGWVMRDATAIGVEAGVLPDELPEYLIRAFEGRIDEGYYRETRARHVGDETANTRTYAGGSWVRRAATWLATASDFDPPYGSRHHINGLLSRALFAVADDYDAYRAMIAAAKGTGE